MYKIGEFSKITSFTVKALRFYEEKEILIPSARDDESGYRLYSEADIEKAKLIALLKAVDFTISEIKEVVDNCQTPSDLSYYLEEKRTWFADRIKEYTDKSEKIKKIISKPKGGEKIMAYDIKEKILDEVLVASIRYKGRYEECGEYIKKLFSVVKNKCNGAPFNIYYDGEFKDDDADIEVCVPVKSAVFGNGVESRKIPAVKTITTIHQGGYETLSNAHKALFDYVNSNGIKLKPEVRETYLKGPGMLFKGNPNNYVTEISYSVED